MKRTETREVKIKDLVLGHNNHVYIQSMCNIPTKQAQKVIEQILNLEKMGCEIIRVSCMDMEDAKAIETIKNNIHIPLVADIHFDYKLALACIEAGAVFFHPCYIFGNVGSIDNQEEFIVSFFIYQ